MNAQLSEQNIITTSIDIPKTVMIDSPKLL